MRNIKCSDCEEYRNEWCEKIVDSPYPDMLRDCQYWHEKVLPDLRQEYEPSYWVSVNNNEVACHKCKSVFVYWLAMYHFCPSCGAYMRTEGNDDN